MNISQVVHLTSDAWKGKPVKTRSPLWGKVRAEHLKLHPKCEACQSTKSVEVHHCKSFSDHPELELDPTNLMSLCDGPNSCHRTWGHMYDWSRINPSVREDVAAWVDHLQHTLNPPTTDI